MSWGLTYVLPWPRLDIPAIEAAIRHVLDQLPARARESNLEVRGPNVANWFLTVYPEEERLWTLDTPAEVDRRFALYEIAEDEGLWLDIVFDIDDWSNDFETKARFRFDSGWSGNSLAPGCAIHVCQILGKYFGVEAEKD